MKASLMLRNDSLRYYSGDVSQAEIAAGVTIGELLVIESQQVQDGGVHIVNMHAILDGVVAEFIGCAIYKPGLHASARHPHRVAVRIVIPAVAKLRPRRAPELPRPDYERILEQTSGLQVLQQPGDRLIDFGGIFWMLFCDLEMMVPTV